MNKQKKNWLMNSLLFTLLIILMCLNIFADESIREGETLDLEQCISIALKNHPAILAVENEIIAKESKSAQAKSDYFPNINLQGGYQRAVTSYSSSNSSVQNSTNNNYSGSINLSQNIYDFGRTSAGVNIQDLNTKSASHGLTSKKLTIIFRVKQAYFNLINAQETQRIAQDTLVRFNSRLEQAQAFFDSGLKPKIDVTKAQTDISNAKLSLIKAQNALKIAKINLTNAMGLSSAPLYTIKPDTSLIKQEIKLDDAIKTSFENRADLKVLQMQLEASGWSYEIAQKGHFPFINGNASVGYGGNDFPLNKQWTLGVNINIPIFSGFLVKNQITEAKANIETLKANEKALRIQIQVEVEQAILNIENSYQQIETAQIGVQNAKENLELANGRYGSGIGNPIEVSDAIISLNNTNISYINALTDYKIAVASLQMAMGIK